MIRVNLKPREWGTPNLAAAVRTYWTIRKCEEFRRAFMRNSPDPLEWMRRKLEEPKAPLVDTGSLAKGGR